MNKPTLVEQMQGGVKHVGSTARASFVASHFILAAGSAVAIFYLVISVGGNAGLAPWITYVAAYIASGVYYAAVENPLRRYMLMAWAYRLAKSDNAPGITDNLARVGRSSTTMTVILLAVTLTLSLFINFDISEGITEEQDSSAEIAQSEKVTTSYDRDVEILREQLAAAPAVDAAAIKQAEKDAALWLRAAQDAQNKNLGNLIRKGNSWALQQLTPRQRRHLASETKRGQDHIQAVRDNATLPQIQAELNNYIRVRSGGRDTVAMATAAIMTGRKSQYNGTVSRRNYLLAFLVLGVLVVYVYSGYLLVVLCVETGEAIDEDPGEGIGKAIKSRAAKINAWAGGKIGSAIDNRINFAVAGVNSQRQQYAPIVSAPRESQNRQPAENSLASGFQREKSEPAPVKVSTESVESQHEVSAPPPPGFANPPKVSAGFWVDEAVAYRKRVYGWWKTAHNKKKAAATREDNRAKAEDAFVWFKGQGCTVTKKEGGKVSIKFPKA